MFSIDGLISGLDTASIIRSLVSFQENQVARLTVGKTQIAQKQSALKAVESSLLTLRSSMGRLNRSANSVFDSRRVSSSNESLVTAAASNGAQTGAFNIRVNAVATAHQLGSAGFTSLSSEITTGNIAIQVGNRPATSITIDSSNNSVAGLVSAINNQVSEVRATTILDQASGQHRILLTSRQTGTENQISITNNLGAASGSASRPDFSGPPVQAASNALVSLGSGPGAITAEYQSNRIDGLISGVTLQLQAADSGKEVTVTVQEDNTAIVDSVQEFVDEFNRVMDLISAQTRYVPETDAAGALFGNRSAIDVQNRLRSFVVSNVPGLSSNLNRLSRIGVGITDNGKLTFDSSKLQDALNGTNSNVTSQDVKRLFGLTATSNNAGVEFILGSSRTRESNVPYQVDITQAAEQATIQGSSDVGASIVIDGTNRDLALSLDGRELGGLQLTAGTYTREALAAHVQGVINSHPEIGSRRVAVAVTGNRLSITSDAFGSASKLSNLTGTAWSPLGFAGTESDTGQDVVGRFLVNGEIEEAVGTGRLLVGSVNNPNTADLQVRVTLRPDQITAGGEAQLSVTRGVTGRIDSFLAQVLDPVRGSFQSANESFESQISAIDRSIARVNAVAEARRTALTTQFAALEQTLAGLQQTSSFLGAQLSSLSSSSVSRR